MTKHLVIPDTQVKPEHSVKHLRWAGQYAADKKPDVIIHIGDHWDMPSLSSYDVGTRVLKADVIPKISKLVSKAWKHSWSLSYESRTA